MEDDKTGGSVKPTNLKVSQLMSLLVIGFWFIVLTINCD